MQGVPGEDGNGITSSTNNGDGTFTLTYDDGTTFTTDDLTGPQGPQGTQGSNSSIPIYTQEQFQLLNPNEGDIIFNYSTQKLQAYLKGASAETTVSVLTSNNGYYSCRYCGSTWAYNYSGTLTEDIWILDLGVNNHEMNENEFEWIIYKDNDLDRNNGMGDVVSFGTLIESGSFVHIGIRGGTNGQWKHLYNTMPTLDFINLEDTGSWHNLSIKYKSANLGWKTIIQY